MSKDQKRALSRGELQDACKNLMAKNVAQGELLGIQQNQISGISEALGQLVSPIRMIKKRRGGWRRLNPFRDSHVEAYLTQLIELEESFTITPTKVSQVPVSEEQAVAYADAVDETGPPVALVPGLPDPAVDPRSEAG